MKTRKKLLIALLSATCLTAGAFGMAACGSSDPQPDPTLYAIYNQYVADNPGSTKTYEEWLKEKFEAVAQPGKAGENGKNAYELYVASLPADAVVPTQAEWLASLVGASGLTPSVGANGNWYLGTVDTEVKAQGSDGLGVKSVAWNEEKTALVITYSDDTTTTVTLPEDVTHVHDYTGAPVVAVIAPTGETEGIGYQTCVKDGCEHIELVTIGNYSYKVTVTLSDIGDVDPEEAFRGHTPAVGATVTLKDGEKVVATATTNEQGEAIFEDVERGEYAIEVTKDGYLGEVVYYSTTQDKIYDYNAILIALPSEGNGTQKNAYKLDLNLSDEYFYLKAPKDEENGSNVYISFTAKKAGFYTFTNMDEDEKAYFDPYYGSQFTLSLDENESISFFINNFFGGYSGFLIKVACKEGDRGTQDIPVAFKPGEQVTFTAEDAEEYTYFKLSGDNSKYIVTFEDADLELTYLGYEEIPLASGDTLDLSNSYGNQYFKATGVSAISFKLEYAEGTRGKPYTIEVDETKTLEIPEYTYSGFGNWYKFTVASDATYVIEVQGDLNVVICAEDEDMGTGIQGIGSYDFKAGTYYIQTNGFNYGNEPASVSFKIRAVAEDDFGKIAAMPLAFEGNTATVSLKAPFVYLVYTAPADGFVTFSEADAVYADAAYSEEVYTYPYYDIEVKEGDKLYLTIGTSEATEDVVITANFTAKTENVTYTVSVADEDGANVDGLTVKITDGTNEYTAVVADGVATFENKPAGHYEASVVITEGTKMAIDTERSSLYLCAGKTNASVKLYVYEEYTFNLVVPEGVTLPEDIWFEFGEWSGRWWTELELNFVDGTTTLNLSPNTSFEGLEVIAFVGYYEDFELDGYHLEFTVEGTTVTVEFKEGDSQQPEEPEIEYDTVALEGNTYSGSIHGGSAIQFDVADSTAFTVKISVALLDDSGFTYIDSLIVGDTVVVEEGKLTTMAQMLGVNVTTDSWGDGIIVGVSNISAYPASEDGPADTIKIVFGGESSASNTVTITQEDNNN